MEHGSGYCPACDRSGQQRCVFAWGTMCRSCGSKRLNPLSLRQRPESLHCGCEVKQPVQDLGVPV